MFGRYSSFSDVWSFGVCMWEIYTYAMQPYVGSSNQQVIEAVLQACTFATMNAPFVS